MSPEDPKQPPPPRIILPGSEPPAGPAPRIIPGGADEQVAPEPPPGPRGASRIILPPGASVEPKPDLPEYPRLRPLVLMPITDQGRELLLVSDPIGIIPGQPVLGIEALAILQLLDGSVSVADITAALMRESKDIRVANMVREFIGQLDELLMLDSPRFEAAYRGLRDEYHRLEIRSAALEGHSYPADRPALEAWLDSHFAEAERLRAEAGEPVAPPDARPRALLAPHLDPRRAGAAIARAYLELGPAQPEPLRVVVLGTGHSLAGDLVGLTRKHYQTVLGKMETDTAFVDTVAAEMDGDPYHGELAHRDEHSIEFQVLYLQRRLGAARVRLVPILCGGFTTLLDRGATPREEPQVERLLGALAAAERRHGGATVYVGAIDLSHVGPRFGDPRLDERSRAEVGQKDRAALDAAARGDAEAWFGAIAAHDDSTRNCGFAPTYLLLRALAAAAGPVPGRPLRYLQSDEPDGSMVSTAAMVWP